MTEQQLNQLAEMVVNRLLSGIAEREEKRIEKVVNQAIRLHEATCAASKYIWIKNLLSSVIGGAVVGLLMLLLNHFANR
ncbi:MAG TPA: hypothetical protein PLV55_06000 [Anaerohalosphaeraceae bacterium]|nr:hypothetical protein [Anaerohalosphaeraceae bacterium]